MILATLFFGLTLAAGSGQLPGISPSSTPPLQGPPPPKERIHSPSTQTHPKKQPIAPKNLQDFKNQPPRGEAVETEPTSGFYIYPGIVRIKDNSWIGYDYLYNLTNNIPIEVKVVKPADLTSPFSEETIKQKIVEAFQHAGIDTVPQIAGGRPPVALFNMLILVYPLSDGFVAVCEGRLLESVDVKRVTPDPVVEGTLQAILWEQKRLIVSASDGFLPLLEQNVENVVHAFLERYDFFKSLKNRSNSPE